MSKKLTPYIFLVILGFVLIYILGFRSGQKVEKTNKDVNFLLSLPPTKPPAPTPLPLEFKTYKHMGCGVSFLYPDFFKVEKESSTAALLKDKKTVFSLNCAKGSAIEPTIDPKYSSFEKLNSKNNKKIIFIVEKSLLPLFEKSLEFYEK